MGRQIAKMVSTFSLWGSLFFVFVFIDPWYLSARGSDTPQCGTSYQNACLTLDYLLKRSYSETHSPTMTIVTDENITFNYSIKVRSDANPSKTVGCELSWTQGGVQLSSIQLIGKFAYHWKWVYGRPHLKCLACLNSVLLWPLGNNGYSKMYVIIVIMENYVFLERRKSLLS